VPDGGGTATARRFAEITATTDIGSAPNSTLPMPGSRKGASVPETIRLAPDKEKTTAVVPIIRPAGGALVPEAGRPTAACSNVASRSVVRDRDAGVPDRHHTRQGSGRGRDPVACDRGSAAPDGRAAVPEQGLGTPN